MNYSVFRFTLNMHNHRSQVAIPVFLGDTGIRLHINLTDGGNPYIIEDGCTAYIRGKKPDGKGLFNPCLILNNTMIQYDFTEQTSNREGITTCEIELYGKDGTLITAPKFIIVVDSRSLSDSEIAEIIEDSDSEVGIIPKILATIESEEARVEAETSRVNAEADRVMSEEEREVNEAGRVKTEQERVTAEESRVEAERLRAEAEAKRIKLDEAVSLSDSMFASANLVTEAANRVESIKSSITRNSKRITNLERGIVPSPFETDSDVAYIKDVPENALPYAGISKIGGMSRKCTNLLKLLEFNSGIAGVVVKTNPNANTVIINGTATSNGGRNIKIGQITLKAGTYKLNSPVPYVVVSNSTTNGYIAGLNPFTLTEETTVHVGFNFTQGETYNTTISMWLNEGGVELPFEPYYEGLRDAKVTAVKSVGTNLFGGIALANKIMAEAPTKSVLDTSAKTIKFYAGETQGKVLFSNFKPNTRYSFLLEGSGTAKLLNLKITYTDGTVETLGSFSSADTVEPVRFVSDASKSIKALSGEWQSGYTTLYYEKCGIFEGDVAYADFKPCVEHTLAIPEAVQSLEGYGLGINSSLYNYIDFEGKKFNRVVRVVDLGTYDWAYITGNSNGAFFQATLGKKSVENSKCLCSKYESTTAWYIFNSSIDKVIGVESEYIAIRDTSYTDASAFKSAMSGVMLVYELATPTTEDISEIIPFDNLIGVEGGGTLTFENEYGYDVPSEVTYQIKEVAV